MTAYSVTAPKMDINDARLYADSPSSWLQIDNADALVKTGAGVLKGILCTAAAGTPTLVIYDNTSATGATIAKSFTPVAGTFYNFYNLYFETGLYLDKGGTTVELTVIYR